MVKHIRKLLKVREARVLMYVWGGNHAREVILPSPYLGARWKTIIRRPAGIGVFRESVDLATDYSRAFGAQKTVLVDLALSSDSDDTETMVRALARPSSRLEKFHAGIFFSSLDNLETLGVETSGTDNLKSPPHISLRHLAFTWKGR